MNNTEKKLEKMKLYVQIYFSFIVALFVIIEYYQPTKRIGDFYMALLSIILITILFILGTWRIK